MTIDLDALEQIGAGDAGEYGYRWVSLDRRDLAALVRLVRAVLWRDVNLYADQRSYDANTIELYDALVPFRPEKEK